MSAVSRRGLAHFTFKYEKGLSKGHIRKFGKDPGHCRGAFRTIYALPIEVEPVAHFFFLVFPRLIVVEVNRLGGGCSEAISLSCSYFEIACELNTGS